MRRRKASNIKCSRHSRKKTGLVHFGLSAQVFVEEFLAEFRDSKDGPWRVWKGHDWDFLDRLCQKGLIFDPKNKAKSVALTDEGYEKARELFEAKYVKKA